MRYIFLLREPIPKNFNRQPQRRLIYESELHPDPLIASWLFESSVIDESTDPLAILISRESESNSIN